MQSKLEIEYKVLLTHDEFNTLLRLYPYATKIDQTNFYYDSTPSLKTRGMGCRIRKIGNHFIFTLKIKQESGHKEIEFNVDFDTINQNSIQECCKKYEIGPLEKVGELHTIRHLIDLETAELCIDENHYNGLIDYEVEYELKEASIDTFSDFLTILNQGNITYVPNKKSKIHRCLASKKSD